MSRKHFIASALLPSLRASNPNFNASRFIEAAVE